jgi:hypothetical protein
MASCTVQLVRAVLQREVAGFWLMTCWPGWQMPMQMGEGRALYE